MNILHYREVDRLPAVHFGYWAQLLDEWAEQGHITKELVEAHKKGNKDAKAEMNKIFGWDCGWSDGLAGTRNGLFPRFERKTLEVLPDGSHRIINGAGVIERVKPGIVSIPSEDDYQLKDREAFETLYRPKMQFSPERVNYEFFRHFNETRNPDMPVGIGIGSVMGSIRDMTTVVGMSYLMYDEDEDLFADIVDAYAELQYKCAEEALSTGAQFDYAHFWEDICFKNGPLLSPKKFDELCGKHYKKRCDLCHAHGIDIISLDCDGVIESLIPTWIENGVNVLFPIEVG
ncbi:MAG: hypothetical protein IJF74_08285, partial [Clostridia bacterium]|nr:hypothetical protein [Clostridia bacterium]